MADLAERVEMILADVRAGKPVIITDSTSREDEGDIMIAAELATPETLAFMARYGRGIMCVPTTAERLERMGIGMMFSNKLDKWVTPFACSVDASHDIATGVSVADRMVTLNLLCSETSVPSDFAQPGHLFPLRARPGLLKERQGHTEAGVELCVMAGLKPVSVIIEVMNDDGSMSRRPELEKLAEQFGLNLISIDELIEYQYGK